MLVCLFVQTVVFGGWKSLKTCGNAKKKKILGGGWGGGWESVGGVGNHLKHVEMQKKKKNLFVCLFVCLLQVSCG